MIHRLQATDAMGEPLTVEDLLVTGVVETAKAGTYKMTYRYTDAAGNMVTATATITVTADAEQPGGGGQGNSGDNNNGDGDLINEGNGGNYTAPGSNGNGNQIKPGNSGSQTTVTGDQILSSQPSLKQPTVPIKSIKSLPQANEKRAASWLALAGVGLMVLLATVGYRRKH